LAFFCADCDHAALVTVEGFSGGPAAAELAASWGVDLLHGRRRASRRALLEARACCSARAARRSGRGALGGGSRRGGVPPDGDGYGWCDYTTRFPVEGFSGCLTEAEVAVSLSRGSRAA
jgi:hypothetical protein